METFGYAKFEYCSGDLPVGGGVKALKRRIKYYFFYFFFLLIIILRKRRRQVRRLLVDDRSCCAIIIPAIIIPATATTATTKILEKPGTPPNDRAIGTRVRTPEPGVPVFIAAGPASSRTGRAWDEDVGAPPVRHVYWRPMRAVSHPRRCHTPLDGWFDARVFRDSRIIL